MSKRLIAILILLLTSTVLIGQKTDGEERYHYRVTLSDPTAYELERAANGQLRIIGSTDPRETAIYEGHELLAFEPYFPGTKKAALQKVFKVVTSSPNLLSQLVSAFPETYEKVDQFYPEEQAYYPNDYGATSPYPNYGTGYALRDLDLIRMPEAWGITRGSAKVRIGLSDAKIDSTNPDLKGRVGKYLEYFENAKGMICAHGTNVAGIAVARMDNRYGRPGICAECDVVVTGYGKFSDIEALVAAGARVINASWARCSMGKYHKEIEARINELYEDGILIVAGAGNARNCNRDDFAPDDFAYPASFEKVISVTGVFSRFDHPLDSLFTAKNGRQSILGLKDRHAEEHNVLENGAKLIPRHLRYAMQFNEAIDICAPAQSYLLGHDYCGLDVTFGGATSSTAPYITGVIGLIWSVNYCLDAYETESILKLTAEPIDQLPGNEPFRGKLGAGRVDAYRAVKMARDMKEPMGTVLVQGRDFSRFDFRLRHAPYRIELKDQVFRDSSKVAFTARNQIVLRPGTRLAPDNLGFVRLGVDPDTPTEDCYPEPPKDYRALEEGSEAPWNGNLNELFKLTLLEDKAAILIAPRAPFDNKLRRKTIAVTVYSATGELLKNGSFSYPNTYTLALGTTNGKSFKVVLKSAQRQATFMLRRK